jgi:tetratricopeptide (TPR) repeat protein
MDRCQWSDAELLLAPLKRRLEASRVTLDPFYLIAILNMLGACAAMSQDFERGLTHFRAAAEAFQRDFDSPGPASKTDRYLNGQGVYLGAWLEQNLALGHEWLNRMDIAEQHWNRYFDYLEHYVPRSMPPDYLSNLAFEGASRLADLFSRKEKWGSAAQFLQRAHRLRPTDYETLERLFHMYTQLKRTDDARKLLRRLREVRPNDPQAELFELEVREVRKLDDVDALMSDLRRIAQRFPNNTRVEERGAALVQTAVPILERIADQYKGQVDKVVDQMRRLPSYQINWPTVRDIMRDMEDKYLFLRRVAQKCLAHVANDDVRRELHRLISHCDRKIDQCHSLGE